MGAFKFVSEVEKIQWRYQKKEKQKPKKRRKFTKTPLVPVLGEFYLSERPEQKQFTKDDPDRRTNMVLWRKFSRI